METGYGTSVICLWILPSELQGSRPIHQVQGAPALQEGEALPPWLLVEQQRQLHAQVAPQGGQGAHVAMATAPSPDLSCQ